MFNYEGYKEATPNAATYTVPDDAQLRGDFSNLRDAQGRLITIYDPNTGRVDSSGAFVRDPFPNNQIPANRIDPMAARFVQYFLRPNTTPPAGTDPWRSNLLLRAQPRVRHLPQLRDQGRSEHQRKDADVRPLRLQQTDGRAVHQRHHHRTRAGRPAATGTYEQDGSLRLGAHRQFVLGVQRPRRA